MVDLKESITSYLNAFECAGIDCYMPYAHMRMSIPLDLNRIRNGEPKYIVRELFKTMNLNHMLFDLILIIFFLEIIFNFIKTGIIW